MASRIKAGWKGPAAANNPNPGYGFTGAQRAQQQQALKGGGYQNAAGTFGANTGTASGGSAAGSSVASPSDAQYQAQLNALNTRLANQNLGFQQKEYGVKEQYGFDPEFAANPYTRANLLARKAQQRFTGTTNAMASRGQLYSGAVNRARSADTFTSGQETDEARREYARMLQDIGQQRLEAQGDYGLSQADAFAEMLDRFERRATDASQFSAGPETGGGGGGGGNKNKNKGKKKK